MGDFHIVLGDLPTWIAAVAASTAAWFAGQAFKAQNIQLSEQAIINQAQLAELRQMRLDSEFEYQQKRRAQAALIESYLIFGEQRITPVQTTTIIKNNSAQSIHDVRIRWYEDRAEWFYGGLSEEYIDIVPSNDSIQRIRGFDLGANRATLWVELLFTDTNGFKWVLRKGQLTEVVPDY